MCCRLQLDLRELLKRGNGLFGSAEQTGSLGVVTVTQRALDGLYLMIGEEEKKIRENPVSYGSKAIAKVFGLLK